MGQPKRVGSPRLDESEWTLLLDLYLRRRPESVSVGDPELVSLSQLLAHRAVGHQRPPTQWRSPDGLQARMSVFRVLDPDVDTVDTKSARTATKVWNRYFADCEALSAEITRIGRSIGAGALSALMTGKTTLKPSRGPVPWSGITQFERHDLGTWVYVLSLDAVLGVADVGAGDTKFVKVGRSSDVERRVRELNEGFPPQLGLRWKRVDAISFATADDAHRVEQDVLRELHRLGLSAGGEFARCSPVAAAGLVRQMSPGIKNAGDR